jgi:hypothetical protein
MACTLARDVALTDRVGDAGPRVFAHHRPVFILQTAPSDRSTDGQQSVYWGRICVWVAEQENGSQTTLRFRDFGARVVQAFEFSK